MKTLFAALLALTLICPAPATAADKPMSGQELALRWPDLIGEVVTVRVAPVRAIQPGKMLVRIDATEATVLAVGKVWKDAQVVCATVMGTDTIADRGRTTVVALMLTTCK
jgi:hypothetical protein